MLPGEMSGLRPPAKPAAISARGFPVNFPKLFSVFFRPIPVRRICTSFGLVFEKDRASSGTAKQTTRGGMESTTSHLSFFLNNSNVYSFRPANNPFPALSAFVVELAGDANACRNERQSYFGHNFNADSGAEIQNPQGKCY